MRARALLLSTLLLALAAPATEAATSTHARNVAHLWALVGDADPEQLATLRDGRVVTLEGAIDAAAARAGAVDLAALASGAGTGGGTYFGDTWVLEMGQGACSLSILAPGAPASAPLHPQMKVEGGNLGSMSTTHGYYTSIYDWSTKEFTTAFDTGGFTAAGFSDFFCISFGALHLAFPFIFGCVQVH